MGRIGNFFGLFRPGSSRPAEPAQAATATSSQPERHGGALPPRTRANESGSGPAIGTPSLAPRTGGFKLANLRKAFQQSRSGTSVSLGPFGQASQTQQPSGPQRLVQAKRFTGDGSLKAADTNAGQLMSDIDKAVEHLSQPEVQPQGKPSSAATHADQAVRWAQLALSTVGLSMGPASTPREAVGLFRGSQPHPADGIEPSPLTELHHTVPQTKALAALAVAEKANAAIELASLADMPDEQRLRLKAAADKLNEARATTKEQAIALARQARDEVLQSISGAGTDATSSALRARIQSSARTLCAKLDGASQLPDVLSSQVLADCVIRLFGGANEASAAALEGLVRSTPADLGRKALDALTRQDAMRSGQPTDPALRLCSDLAGLPGGAHILSKAMTGKGLEPPQQEALRVAFSAVHAMQKEIQSTNKVSQQQIEWLAAATEHAISVLSKGPADAKQPGPEGAQKRLQHIAYRGVQNGFVTNEPGSPYALANAKLASFASSAHLEQTAQRNVRAASGRMGRLMNWASAGLPKSLLGSEPTVWRKSALAGLTKAASRNGMLPTRTDAVASLNRTASDIYTALVARRDQIPESPPLPGSRAAHQAAACELMLAILEVLQLGVDKGTAPQEASLKRLGSAFFSKVEARLGPDGLAQLDPGLSREWQQLHGTHPNAGHVLKLLTDHMDLRALLDPASVPALGELIGPNLIERGQRNDRLRVEAVQAFAEIAKLAQNAAARIPDRPQATALASLTQATAETLATVKPLAALVALRIDTFEAIENKLTKQWLAQRPKAERADWHEAKRQVIESWPAEVRQAWLKLKGAGPNAVRLMHTLADAVVHTIRDTPAPADQASTSQAPATLHAALKEAAVPLQALQRGIHAHRFERAVADTITLFNDVRTPRDAGAVMESLSQRVSLGERLKNTDARRGGIEIGRMISTLFSTPPVVISPLIGASVTHERSMDINMSGSTLQMWIGDTWAKGGAIGLNVGLRGDLGETDHQFNLEDDDAALALRFDLRAEAGREFASMDGLSVRMPRVSGHEDMLRREFGAALADLAQPDTLQASATERYPDLLAAMLDRHPKLVVANLNVDRDSRTGESGAGAAVVLRSKGLAGPQESEHDRLATAHAIRLGGAIGVTAKSLRQSAAQTEANGQLRLEEYKLSAQQRTEFKAGIYTPVALLPWDTQRGDGGQIDRQRHTAWVPLLRGAGADYTKQLANSGVDTTLRLVTHKGETWADQTQLIREHEQLSTFLADLEPRLHQFATAMTGKDDVQGAPMNEKIGRAWDRMRDTLSQATAAHGPNMSFIMVTKLRHEAATARDNLEALAVSAERAGQPARAQQLRAEGDALLANPDAWTAGNMQFKTKAKNERSQTVTLNVSQGKTSAETTRLHEFLPLGAQNVGRTPDMPEAAPVDHSERWSLTQAGSPLASRYPSRRSSAASSTLRSRRGRSPDLRPIQLQGGPPPGTMLPLRPIPGSPTGPSSPTRTAAETPARADRSPDLRPIRLQGGPPPGTMLRLQPMPLSPTSSSSRQQAPAAASALADPAMRGRVARRFNLRRPPPLPHDQTSFSMQRLAWLAEQRRQPGEQLAAELSALFPPGAGAHPAARGSAPDTVIRALAGITGPDDPARALQALQTLRSLDPSAAVSAAYTDNTAPPGAVPQAQNDAWRLVMALAAEPGGTALVQGLFATPVPHAQESNFSLFCKAATVMSAGSTLPPTPRHLLAQAQGRQDIAAQAVTCAAARLAGVAGPDTEAHAWALMAIQR